MPATAAVSVKIGAVMDSTIGTVFGGVKTQLRQVGDAMKDLSARSQGLKQLDTTTARFGQSVESLSERFAKQQAAVKNSEAALEKLKAQIAATGDADGKLTARLATNSEALARSKARLADTNTSLERAKTDFTQASAAAEQFRSANQHVATSLLTVGSAMRRYEAASAAVSSNQAARAQARGNMLEVLAIGAVLKKLVEKAGETEEAKIRLGFVFDENSVGSIVQQTKEFTRRSMATLPEMLRMESVLGRQGFDAETARFAAETAHKVSVVTEQEAGATAEAIGVVYNLAQTHLAGSTLQKFNAVGDVMAAMQHQFEIRDIGELKSSFAALLPLTQALNVPLAGTAALIGVLARGGQDPAGAALILRNLTKAQHELGFKIKLDSGGNTDLAGTLRNMIGQVAATHGGDFANGVADVQKAFGGRAWRVISYLKDNTDLLQESQKKLANSTGQLNGEYKKVEDSATGMLKKISKNLESVLKPLGTALLPGFKTILQPIGELSEKLAGFLERHKSFTLFIGSAVAGMFTLAFATTVAKYAWTSIKAPWVMGIELLSRIRLRAAAAAAAELGLADATGAEAAANVTANASRIGLLGRLASMLGLTAGAEAAAAGATSAAAGASTSAATGLAALGSALWPVVVGAALVAAAGAALYKWWTPVGAFIQGVGNGLAQGFQPLMPVIDKVWGGLKSFFSWLTEDDTTHEGFKNAFSAGILWGQKLGATLAAVFTTVVQSIGIAINSVATLGKVIEALAHGKFSEIGGIVKQYLKDTSAAGLAIGKSWAAIGKAPDYTPADKAADDFQIQKDKKIANRLGSKSGAVTDAAHAGMASAGEAAGGTTFNATFNINAGSAKDGQSVAQQVEQAMERWVRRTEARQRGGLHN
jgi:TP901 family phage tail tape measure protein